MHLPGYEERDTGILCRKGVPFEMVSPCDPDQDLGSFGAIQYGQMLGERAEELLQKIESIVGLEHTCPSEKNIFRNLPCDHSSSFRSVRNVWIGMKQGLVSEHSSGIREISFVKEILYGSVFLTQSVVTCHLNQRNLGFFMWLHQSILVHFPAEGLRLQGQTSQLVVEIRFNAGVRLVE